MSKLTSGDSWTRKLKSTRKNCKRLTRKRKTQSTTSKNRRKLSKTNSTPWPTWLKRSMRTISLWWRRTKHWEFSIFLRKMTETCFSSRLFTRKRDTSNSSWSTSNSKSKRRSSENLKNTMKLCLVAKVCRLFKKICKCLRLWSKFAVKKI